MTSMQETRRARFTREGIRRGFLAALPLGVGVFAYGITFGVLAVDAGLSLAEALVMSATVYSGSAQVAAVAGISAGAGLVASVATVLLLNARYVLYGAALRPWLGQATPVQAYASLYILGDGNWVLSMSAHAHGEDDAGFVLGSGLAAFLPWLAGTLAGASSAAWITDPRLFGLDFFLVAFCAAMGIGLFRSRADWWPVAAAFVAALAADRLAPSGWTIVAAGLAGALIAYVRQRPNR
jgi:predicted branched-subunit amino acid permease